MAIRALPCIVSVTLALTGCSFGPRLHSGFPEVRDVPVLANLSPAESLVRARGFLAARQYGLAIELFRTAGHDPSLELDSLNGLAIAYDGIGRGDLAERYFQKALALRTDDARTRRNLATFYATSKQQEKRLALLADTPVRSVQPPVAAADADAVRAQLPADAVTDTDVHAMADLPAPSPLGTAFRPLLAQAGLAGHIAPVAMPVTTDISVICTVREPAAASRVVDDVVKMFRISVGEVFITTEPGGASCSLAEPAAKAPGPQQVSNKAYLGFVAAYLQQLDWWQGFAGLPPPTSGVS